MKPLFRITALVIRGAIWLAAQSPDLWNLPEKERFLQLSDAERVPIVEAMEDFLGAMSIFVTLVFVALQAGMYATAVGWTDGLPWYVTLFVYGGLAAVLVAAVLVNRRMAARIRRAHEARARN